MFCFSCSRRNSIVGTLVRSLSGAFSRSTTPEPLTSPSQTVTSIVASSYNLRPLPRVSYAEHDPIDGVTYNSLEEGESRGNKMRVKAE